MGIPAAAITASCYGEGMDNCAPPTADGESSGDDATPGMNVALIIGESPIGEATHRQGFRLGGRGAPDLVRSRSVEELSLLDLMELTDVEPREVGDLHDVAQDRMPMSSLQDSDLLRSMGTLELSAGDRGNGSMTRSRTSKAGLPLLATVSENLVVETFSLLDHETLANVGIVSRRFLSLSNLQWRRLVPHYFGSNSLRMSLQHFGVFVDDYIAHFRPNVDSPRGTSDQGHHERVQYFSLAGLFARIHRDIAFKEQILYRSLVEPDYMKGQREINLRMRRILIDWLMEVHMKFRMKDNTLFLTVIIIDRFLERRRATKRKLQLVGLVALLIASKFEEVHPPGIRDLVYICAEAYTSREILQAELVMLRTLDFEVGAPTITHFFDKFACHYDFVHKAHRYLAQYLLELMLPDIKILCWTPSHVAAASLLQSCRLLYPHRPPSHTHLLPWPQAMVDLTGYTEDVLQGCCNEMRNQYIAAPGTACIARRKFSSWRYGSVSTMNL